MLHASYSNRLPSSAQNTTQTVLWSDKKFSIRKITSTNDKGQERSKIFLERNIHASAPVDAVLVFARIKLDGETYFVLTRQWREATGKYCIDAPAGVYDPMQDNNAENAGLRELREETPLDAEVVLESMLAYSSAGCTSETIQVLVVDAKPKNDQVKFERGIVTGPTEFDKGEDIVTLYVHEDKLHEELLDLQANDHAIDARLMTWALCAFLSRMTTRQTEW